MIRLAEEANKYHGEVKYAWRGAICHARKCGETLNKAKALMKHGSWKKWLRNNFDASYETAVIYMRIDQNWDAPCLDEARSRKTFRISIKSMLQVLRDKQPTKGREKPRTEQQQKEVDKARNGLLRMFKEVLDDSYDETLIIFYENFDYNLWPQWYKQLKELVISKLKYNPYPKDDEDEWPLSALNNNGEKLKTGM